MGWSYVALLLVALVFIPICLLIKYSMKGFNWMMENTMKGLLYVLYTVAFMLCFYSTVKVVNAAPHSQPPQKLIDFCHVQSDAALEFYLLARTATSDDEYWVFVKEKVTAAREASEFTPSVTARQVKNLYLLAAYVAQAYGTYDASTISARVYLMCITPREIT